MGIKDDYEGNEIINEATLATKQDALTKKVETLLTLVKDSSEYLEQKFDDPDEAHDEERLFYEFTDYMCKTIPFSTGADEVHAYLDHLSPRGVDMIEEMDMEDPDFLLNILYLTAPAAFIQKAYNEGDNNFYLDYSPYKAPFEAFLTGLIGTPGKPLEITLRTNKEVESALSGCFGCSVKIVDGTPRDSIGDDMKLCDLYHESEEALETAYRMSEHGCFFYLINPDGTTQRMKR